MSFDTNSIQGSNSVRVRVRVRVRTIFLSVDPGIELGLTVL